MTGAAGLLRAARAARRGFAVVALLAWGQASAGNILGRAGNGGPSQAPVPTAASQAAAAAAAQAGSLTRQADSPLRRALDAVQAFQSGQQAARAAASAAAAAAGVPDGLAGLVQLPAADGGVWTGAEGPVETSSGGKKDVTIKQTDARAVLTWKRFDVGALTNLTFDQSAGLADASSWVALNRVLDPSAAPSRILGTIKAPGQVYVLNRNGILFGGTAQVNVGSLLLSGLEISATGATEADRLKAANDRFRSASLSGLSFDRGGAAAAGPITIEAGATLAADPGGRVVALGGSVINAGTLAAPDGQVFLAAGSSIQLAASGNLTQVRGLAPPVAAGAGSAGTSPVLLGDGPVENAAGGVITARRGNVTMVGRETRQDGLVTVTNGAEVVGSIDLGTAVGGFTTSFGQGSVTQILPDLGDKAVLGAGTTYQPSAIRVNGDRITVGPGATLYAPSGSIALVAAMAADRPAGATDPTVLDDTRIDVGAGARIDVSGLRDVEVAMESNSIKGELRANELRDNPLLRTGALHGRTAYFDARLGSKLKDGSGVADLSGYYDLLSRSVPQLMTSGGSITLDANQIVTAHGSVLDLSGGSQKVLGGYVRRTVLVDSTGRRTPIEEAVKGVQYVGTADDYVLASPRFGQSQTWSSPLTQARARYEAGYLQGGAAGALSIGTLQTPWSVREQLASSSDVAPRPIDPSASGAVRLLDGQVVATTVVGPKQRALPTGTTDPAKLWSERPAGATLAITGAGDVTFAEQADLLPAGYATGDAVDPALRYRTVLPLGWFRKGGTPTFSAVGIEAGYDPDETLGSPVTYGGTIDRAAGGHLTLGAGQALDLGTGGTFSFTGKAATLEAGATIVAPGGSVSLLALRKGSQDPLERAVRLEAGARIDVAGRWNNEALDGPTTPLEALGGGSVKLTGASVALAAGSYLDVSGGGRLDATGTKLTPGAGGAITIDTVATPQPSGATAGNPLKDAPLPSALQLAGTLEGHALGQGGALTIRSTGALELGGALDPSAGLLDAGFLGRGGFAAFTLVGERGVTVRGEVAPMVESYLLPELASAIPGGTRLADVASTAVLRDPGGLGKAMRLTLSTGGNQYAASAAAVEVLPGAAIRLQPGSTVSLFSSDALLVEGAIQARGGAISLSSSDANGQRGVTLASGASLDVSGYQTQALVAGALVRGVSKGGAVTVAVANANAPLTLAEGSLIDASGVSGVADLATGSADPLSGGRTAPVAVDGGAGTIAISAQAGLIAGALRLGPGGGAASTGLGGALTVTSPRIRLSQGLPAAGAGAALQLVADRVDASRADDVTLDVGAATAAFDPSTTVLFDGAVHLSARRSLSLLAPIIGTVPGRGGAVLLDAASVSLVGGAAAAPVAAGAVDLGSTLTVKAGLIDVARTLTLGCSGDAGAVCASGGFSTARLDAGQGDLRLTDHDPAGRDATADVTAASAFPGLLSTGAVELQGGQVYVASRGRAGAQPGVLDRPASQPGFLVQSDARVSVLPPATAGAIPAVPLAFGERLTLRAPTIEQDGVLRAPAGEIRLEARNLDGTPGAVTLGSGSLTSISLAAPDGSAGLVPFGDVLSGGVFYGYHQAGQAPSLSVKLTGARVAVASGATVDVSGGGDLLGYSFVPGTGGSRDVLSPVVSAAGDWKAAPALGSTLAAPFAVLPSLGTAAAPIGPVSSLRDGRLHVGDQIHLQGVPGLADGDYTLLPAHDALLPGGRLVLPLGGAFASAPATTVRPDGAVVAAGYRLAAGTAARDPGYGQYAVMGSDVFGAYSDLSLASFDGYATRLAAEAGVGVRTPNDGGSLALAASESLSLLGAGRFGAGQGGRLGTLDVSAARIAVVGAADAARYAGYLTLDPQALSDFKAGSLLLGGTRTASTSATAPGTTLQVAASEVVVDTGGVALSAPEILLAAQQRVTVADGAVMRAEGAAAGDASTLRVTGDGAVARLSTGGRVGLVRTGGSAGDLAIGQATLVAAGSVALDAASALGMAAGATLTTPQLDLGSNLVHLGAAPAGAGGTILTTATIERLAATSDLLVRGRDAIWLDGDLTLGTRAGGTAAASLALDTALLQGSGGATARLTAATLALRNSGSSIGAGSAGTGTLQLDVDTLALGPGQVAVGGFGQVAGRAGTIQALGSGGLSVAGSLGTAAAPLATGRLSAAAGTSYDLAASGAVALGTDAAGGSLPAASGLGGRLTLTGASVLLDTAVALPAGTFEAAASGGALGLGAHATVDVSGRTVDLAGQLRSAAGGAIRLTSAGDLSVASGASLDVSASAQGGDAGRIELSARQGLASVAGALTGKAAAGRGGTFALEADRLDGFAALNGALETSGFSEARAFRVRGAGQDLRLAEGERIGAHDVTLRADAGQVVVAGAIGLRGDEAHAAGGRIELTGAIGLTLASTATLEARAAATEGAGFTPGSGRVLLATGPTGTVTVGGATVDASGGRDGGEIVVRAPRTADGVAVAALDGRFTAATQVVQGEATYQASAVDGAWLAAHPVQAEAAAWLAAARARHPQGPGGFTLAPAIRVASDGALSVQGTLSLAGLDGSGAPVAGGPGQLTLSARGDLAVGGVVSDGFASGARDAALLAGRSYGLTLEADGNATFGVGALVRTGTGDLAVRASGDLVLADPTAALYTAGARSPWAAGFQNAGATSGAPVGEFPTQGGDVDLSAGGSLIAPTTLQTTSAWLFRRGASAWGSDVSTSTVTQQASWSVVYKNFQQGVAALGGGDVRVRAGEDVSQLAVALPTTGQVTTAVGQATQPGDLVVRGGGDLQVSAGRDLLGGLYVVGLGRADLRAGRDVAAAGKVGLRRTADNSAARTQLPVGLLLGLGDATATVAAAGSTALEGLFDPMRQGQIAEALAGGATGAAWVGYSDRTSVRAVAAGGGVTYANDPWASTDLSLAPSTPIPWRVDLNGNGSSVLSTLFNHAPPSLELASLTGSVALQNRLGASQVTLESAPRGTLSLLAMGDVRLGLDVVQEELDPRYQRTWRAPYATTAGALGTTTAAVANVTSDPTINFGKGTTPLHAGDPTPDRVVAVQGSVCAQAGGSCQRLPPPLATNLGVLGSLQLPKALELSAGLDVLAGEYRIQGNSASDLSTITAGRDVYQPILELFGPGTALVRAGRDVVLGEPTVQGLGGPPPLAGGAILSLGNRNLLGSIYNSALPRDQATQVLVMAGVRPGREDTGRFAAAYLDPANATQRAVHDYLPALRTFMAGLGGSAGDLSEGDLVAAFQALPLARRETFLAAVLLTELKETGIDHNDPKSPRYQSYARATAALAALYGEEKDRNAIPATERGDILLHGKQVETDANTFPATAGTADLMTAGLTLLAPFGRVEVGTDLLQGGVNPSLGGVVTRRGGDVRILADQNVDLFSSRVFTLQGGDVTMWSTRGSITAGVGSKTSVFQRPLAFAMTPSGQVQVDAFGLQTGAGIGVLDALDDAGTRPASRMDLLAPKGEVDAGEAGIRAVGNLNIAAAVVVGVENIQATGVSTGVPKVDAPNLGVISSAAAVAQAAASEGVGPQASARNAAADLPSIVTVEVIGYEAPAGETEEERRKKKAKPAR